MKIKVAVFVILGLAFLSSLAVAGNKKPMAQWKCDEFLALDAQFQPKAVYAATELTKKGKPEASVLDIDGTEKVIPVVIDECKKAPQGSFWDKVKAAWKKVESDTKKAF